MTPRPPRSTLFPYTTLFRSQIVRQPERVVRADRDPVRPAEDPLAPRAEEVPVPVEDDDRVRAAVEDVDVVCRVDGHARGLDVGPPLGQPAPPRHRTVVHDRPSPARSPILPQADPTGHRRTEPESRRPLA